GFRHDHDVFLTCSAEPRIIQSRLDGQYLSSFQRNFLQTRMLVNLQPQAVTGPVKEANAPPLANLRRKTALGEEFLNCLVNCHSIHSRFDLFQSERLPGFYCFPKLSLRIARAPRSEEHTSELQSRSDLVCRLLLEKKK